MPGPVSRSRPHSAAIAAEAEVEPLPAAPRTAEELQALIDQAPPYSTIACDRNQELIVSTPIGVRKPLSILGLAARLPDGLGKSPLLVVEAEGVAITDFVLRGNADTVEQSQRASTLIVNAGNFRIENGRFENVAKNGLSIEPRKDNPQDIVGGVARNLVGDGVVRDTVSISGGEGVAVIRNVLVEYVRGYRSSLRGAVEVSDGTADITVRNIYAEDCVYAVDIQDHNNPKQVNANVLVDNVTAVRCRHAVRFNVHDFGHRDITLQNITAVDNEQPLHAKHVDRLTVNNVRIFGSGADVTPVVVTDCSGAIFRDLWLERVPHAEYLVRIDSSDHVLIDGVVSRDTSGVLKSAIAPVTGLTGIVVRNLLIGGATAAESVTNSLSGEDAGE